MKSTRSRPRLRRRPAGPAWWRPLGLASATAEVGDYRVHWVEAGDGDECVVLLHGLSGSSRWWQRNLPALAATRRVLVPDVIGFGRSRAPGRLPDVPTLANVLAEWIVTALSGSLGLATSPVPGEVDASASPRSRRIAPSPDRRVNEPGGSVHLVGHSMGGHLAMRIAATRPELVRRLVLVDAVGIPRTHRPRDLLRLAWEAAPPRRWGDPRFLPVIWTDALVAGPFNVLRGLYHILRDDVRPLLGSIRAPTLVIWGERDGLVPLAQGRALRDGIAGARLLVIPRAHHNPMVDRPAEFDAAVLRFLDGGEVGE